MLLASDTFSSPVFPRKGGTTRSYLRMSAHRTTCNPKDNSNHIPGQRRCLKACENVCVDGRKAEGQRSTSSEGRKDAGEGVIRMASTAHCPRDTCTALQDTKHRRQRIQICRKAAFLGSVTNSFNCCRVPIMLL